MKVSRVLITGGAGFIGHHLTLSHVRDDIEVVIIDNLITGNEKNIVKSPLVSFYNEDTSTVDLSKLKNIDIVYHLASPASPIHYKKYPIETLRANSEGTYNVLRFVEKNIHTRFVMASTSEVYGDPLVHPQTEDYFGNVNSVGPRACYDEGKRYAEAMIVSFIKMYNIRARIARIFNTYGPNMQIEDGRVISNFVNQAIRNEPITIYGDGSQTRSPCYVDDLVRGLRLLGETNNIDKSIINLGNTQELTISQIAETILKATKSSSEIEFIPIDKDDPQKRKPDISRAKKILNWEPKIDFDEGLNKTIEYFRSLL